MAGDVERMSGTLCGLAQGTLPDKMLIAVDSVDGSRVKLEAGLVIGLHVDNELTNVNGTTKIKVTAVLGPTFQKVRLLKVIKILNQDNYLK